MAEVQERARQDSKELELQIQMIKYDCEKIKSERDKLKSSHKREINSLIESHKAEIKELAT